MATILLLLFHWHITNNVSSVDLNHADHIAISLVRMTQNPGMSLAVAPSLS